MRHRSVADMVTPTAVTVPRSSLVPIVLRLCQSVDGVVDVVNRLTFERDDMSVDVQEATGR
ncbi:hypothetical protein [Streptomyces sp. NPDC097981]|uniref:hypothetical protein n=1 Tax=Streptomyces sp. NPDC097981 TaxID=3155428 RepID=UPI003328C352